MIVEYKLDAGPRGMTVPAWVQDGGYYRDPDNFTMVGWVKDSPREFKVPDSVLRLTLAELIARILDIHARYPMQNLDENNEPVTMTNAEVEEQVTAWYNQKEGIE